MCKNKYTEAKLKKYGDELVKWMKVKDNVWLKDFAIEKGFPASYFARFRKKSEYFKEAHQKAKDIQESKLVKGVLDKKYSASFVKFILKNEAGWKDRIEETIKEEVPSIQFVLAEKKAEPDDKERKKDNKKKEQINIFDGEK